MWGHVDDRLAAFCEGALPEPEVLSVAAHLAVCGRCERLRRETEQGLTLVRALPAARLPEDRAAHIRRVLADPVARARVESEIPRRSRARSLKVAAAVLLVGGALGAAYLKRSPALRVEAAHEPLTAFEESAVALQRQATGGSLALDLRSGSVPDVRAWVQERTGLGASLAWQTSSEDVARFELLGAREVTVAGARAVAVAYRIDARPVVLLTARAEDVPDRPRSWNLVGKTVRHRIVSVGGVRILVWTNSGQVYALVSAMPGPGLESCFVCHTDSRRRALIRGIGSLPSAP